MCESPVTCDILLTRRCSIFWEIREPLSNKFTVNLKPSDILKSGGLINVNFKPEPGLSVPYCKSS